MKRDSLTAESMEYEHSDMASVGEKGIEDSSGELSMHGANWFSIGVEVWNMFRDGWSTVRWSTVAI